MSYQAPPPGWQPGPPDMGRTAGQSFLGGFAGCLGVGLAVALVAFFLLVMAVACGQHH